MNSQKSSRKWDYLGQSKRQFKKMFYSKEILKLIKKFQSFFIFQGLIHDKFNCLRIFKNLWSGPIIIFYVLNNFSYTQLTFTFVLQKDSYNVHNDTDAFLLFLFRKILISFARFFSEPLFVFLITVSCHFLCGEEKIMKYFIGLLYELSKLYEYFIGSYFFIRIQT